MSTITAGWMLPAGTNVVPEPILVQGYEDLSETVGGWIDCVSTTMNHDDVKIVGYVNDEGIILDLEFNYLATALFRQPLYGNCVVLWGLNEDGIEDGENYDVPEYVGQFINTTLANATAESYNMATMISLACDYAVEHGYKSADYVDKLSERCEEETRSGVEGTAMQELLDLVEWVANHKEANEGGK